MSDIKQFNDGSGHNVYVEHVDNLNLVATDSNRSSKDAIRVNALKKSFIINPHSFKFDDNFAKDKRRKNKTYYGRKKKVKELHRMFFVENIPLVSLVAIGGTGKTFFAHKYKEIENANYSNIHHIYLDHDIESDFVERMDRFINDGEFSEELAKQRNIDDKIEGIVDLLTQTVTSTTLLVLDINVTEYEKFKSCKNFLNELSRLAETLYWHILLLSRKSFEDVEEIATMKLSGFEDEPEEAFRMFRDISNVPDYVCPDQRLKEMFETPGFYYHPLLIAVLAAHCKRHKVKNFSNVSKLLDEVQFSKLPPDMHVNDDSVMKYLEKLIDFKTYGKECEIILRHFILWEYNNIPYEVIEELLSKYNPKWLRACLNELVNDSIIDNSATEYRVYGFTIKEACDILYARNANAEEWRYSVDRELELKDKLENSNNIVSDYVGYRLHGTIGNALRKKAETDLFDYSVYLSRVRDVFIAPRNVAVLQNLYHSIYESLYEHADILNPSDELYLLAGAHLVYYPNDDIRKRIAAKCVEVARGFTVNFSCNYWYFDNIATALHDAACSNQLTSEQVKIVCSKVIEIREVIADKLQGEERFDNMRKLAVELFFFLNEAEQDSKYVHKLHSVISDLQKQDESQLTSAFLCQMRCCMSDDRSFPAVLNVVPYNLCPNPTMLEVKKGSYMMGCDDNNAEKDNLFVHRVNLDTFLMSKFPVTQLQWDYVMGLEIPSFMLVDYHRGLGPDYPMYYVSWNMAVKFCNKLSKMQGKDSVYSYSKDDNGDDITVADITKHGYRLPTEAEWEYAARGGHKTSDDEKSSILYSGAKGDDIKSVAWYEDNSLSSTHKVGGKSPNELGIYDMSGNVWEWCQDWYAEDYYSNSPIDNPPGSVSGSDRVLRGGSWSYDAPSCRVSGRNSDDPVIRYGDGGFRLSLSSQQKKEK